MTIEFILNWDGVSPPVWVDYTDYVDLTGLKRTISLNADNDPTKSITAEIEAFGTLFTEIKTNLIDSGNRYSNFYVVRIVDDKCSDNELFFKVEDKSMRWCDNGSCRIKLTLIEYNLTLDCIKATPISDNTSGLFNEYPSGAYLHPRFRYCDVLKPTFIYGMVVTISNALVAFIISMNIAIASITGIIVWIVNLLGGSWSIPQIGYGFAEDLLGCERGHPAPFVRTYIDNVCSVCNLTADQTSMPTLYDSASLINNYYHLCLATAYTTKGVDIGGGRGYIDANKPSWDLGKFLSILKNPFNARWFVYHSKVYFERKDLIGDLIWGATPAIDFTLDTDLNNLLGDVCYTYNGEGKPRILAYNYGTDPSDNIGNELLRRFRGIYQDVSGNVNYTETIEQSNYELGAVCCVLDGKDSAYDANIDKALAGTLLSTDYAGCLKTQGDTFALAKLIIWDNGTDMEDARVHYSAYDVYGSSGANIEAFGDDHANFTPISSSDCRNFNYQMSFDPDADNLSGLRNLWQFHSIDIPDPAKRSNIDVDFTLQYCCRYNSLNLYQKIMLQDGISEAEIYEIVFDYDKREIKIKAKIK